VLRYREFEDFRRRIVAAVTRLNATTPGRWEASRSGGSVVSLHDPLKAGLDCALWYGGGLICEGSSRGDGEFIAHAPSDMTLLLGVVEPLMQERQRLDAAIRRLSGNNYSRRHATRDMLDADLAAEGYEKFTLLAGYLPRAG
jgi:hypothetical protein